MCDFSAALAIAEETNKPTESTKCIQCGKPMNPVEAVICATCGKCCKKNHRKAMGKR
jgi:hypothetical protein